MRRQSSHKMLSFKTLTQHFIKHHQRLCHPILQQCIHQSEVIVIIQHIQIGNNSVIRNLIAAETHHLVEYRQCVTHSSICLLRYNIQRHFFNINSPISSNIFQMFYRIIYRDTIEVIYLTTRQYRSNNLMLLCRCQYKYRMRRWLF